MSYLEDDLHNRPILDLMSTDLEVVEPDDTVEVAAEKMRDAGVGDVLVVEDEKLVGILTDRDIVIRAFGDDRDPRWVRVGEVCSEDDLASVDSFGLVHDAVALMRSKAVRRLPVLEDGKPIGVVSLSDLALVEDSSEVLADLSAAPPNE